MFFKKEIKCWKFAAPLFSAVIVWFANEWQKRAWEQYQRKEESYKKLIRYFQGFYNNTENDGELKAQFNNQLKEKFISQLKLCWLYCPDEVIKKGYAFLETMSDKQYGEEARRKAAGNFMVAIRKDLLSKKLVKKISLSHTDLMHLKA